MPVKHISPVKWITTRDDITQTRLCWTWDVFWQCSIVQPHTEQLSRRPFFLFVCLFLGHVTANTQGCESYDAFTASRQAIMIWSIFMAVYLQHLECSRGLNSKSYEKHVCLMALGKKNIKVEVFSQKRKFLPPVGGMINRWISQGQLRAVDFCLKGNWFNNAT